jgi:hypothetical protein
MLKNAGVVAPVAATAKLRAKGEGTVVADVKARAAKMRGQGLISPKQHAGLIAKADKAAAALEGKDLAE